MVDRRLGTAWNRQDRSEVGVALVLVLWFVAALTVLVTSVVSLVRVDVRASADIVSAARATALADAAIEWALQEALQDPSRFHLSVPREYEFEGVVITITPRWDTGFVNLNAAPQELLRELLLVAGGLSMDDAERFAQAIIEWRTPGLQHVVDDYRAANVPFVPRGGNFVAPEDLLQVLGFDLNLFRKLAPAVTVHGRSSRVNPVFAPLEVLQVLAGGDTVAAHQVYERLRAGDVGVDRSRLRQEFIMAEGFGRAVRMQAALRVDGVSFVRVRWVQRQRDPRREPWRTLHASLQSNPMGANASHVR